MTVPISNMTVTWTDGALHTAIKMNVTDTNSNAGSLLIDLQVGSLSMFSVTKTGVILSGTTSYVSPDGAIASFESASTAASGEWDYVSLKYGNAFNTPAIAFMKTRNASPTAHTIVQNGDGLGGMFPFGSDGAAFVIGGWEGFAVDGAPAAGSIPTKWSVSTGASAYGTPRIICSALGNVVLGGSGLAATATDGFVYIPATDAPPTGVPTAQTGCVPMVYDITNNKFYIYNAGWKGGTNPGVFS